MISRKKDDKNKKADSEKNSEYPEEKIFKIAAKCVLSVVRVVLFTPRGISLDMLKDLKKLAVEMLYLN